jgi:hypothetical protein
VTVHEHVQQVLSAGRDGQVDDDQRFLAERHLEQCGACAAAAEAFARVDALAVTLLVPAGPAPFEAALAARLDPRLARRRPPRRRRFWQLGLAAALAALAVVVVSVLVPSGGRRPLPVPVPTTVPGVQPRQPTLAAVLVRAERAAGDIRTLSGRFTRTWTDLPSRSGSGGTVTSSYRFVFASPDRVRVEAERGAEPQPRLQIGDGPAARRVVAFARGDLPVVTTGVPLVRPQDADALAPLSEGLTLWFRNRLEDPARPATPVLREGRPVHVLRLRYAWSLVAGPPLITHLEVWVDPESYLPTRIRYLDRGDPKRVVVRGDVRYAYERVNRPVPPGAFAAPAGAQVQPGGQFRTMPLERARALAAYRVPQVERLPRPGWRLLRAGFAPVGQPTGAEGGNPPGRDLVVAVYGSGLERLVMTTVLVDDQELQGRPYADPFAGEGRPTPTSPHTLRAGAYAGAVAHLAHPSDDAPYLWFRSRGLVVTLSGAATAGELLAAAESLGR